MHIRTTASVIVCVRRWVRRSSVSLCEAPSVLLLQAAPFSCMTSTEGAARFPRESAAYPVRKPHYVVEVIAGWDSQADGAKANEWLDQLLHALEQNALPGGWANVLGPEERQRAHDFYEPRESGCGR